MKKPQIVVMSGSLEGRRFILKDTLTIGRAPQNDLQLGDALISRKHAVIESTQAGFILRDLSSGNGTFVGKEQIDEHLLSEGDVFRIGSTEMCFRIDLMPYSQWSSVKRPPEDSEVQFVDTASIKVEATSRIRVRSTFLDLPSGNDEEAVTQTPMEIQERLSAVYKANQIISSERDLRKLFARVMDEIFSLVPASNGAILLKNPITRKFGSW